MTSMMLLTCARALCKLQALPPLFCQSPLIVISSRFCLVSGHEDVRSDHEYAISRSHLGRFGTYGFYENVGMRVDQSAVNW